MAENFDARDRRHLSIDAFCESARYQVPGRPRNGKPLRDDYAAHAETLLAQLAEALGPRRLPGADQRLQVNGLKLGEIVEVTTLPPQVGSRAKAAKVPPSLEFPGEDIVVLRAQRNDNRSESVLVFVPDDARLGLSERIREYGREPGTERRAHLERFEVVERFSAPDETSLFTGAAVDLTLEDRVWWELWVRRRNGDDLLNSLVAAAGTANIDVHSDRLFFPDTTVLFFHAAAKKLVQFVARLPGAITEIRRATGTIEPFLDRGPTGVNQHDWVADLAARIRPPPDDAPVVCTLDTGVAAAHPLIAPGLRGAWAYDAAWGVDDHHPKGGHGTSMIGLALHGDLEALLNDSRGVDLSHGAESMKLLPPAGFPKSDPPTYGVITQGAVSLVEIERPNVLRSFCLATSTTDFPPDRPSTWSGALDQIASGSMLGDLTDGVPASELPKRLLVVATGNVSGGQKREVLQLQPLNRALVRAGEI